jgi:hypothetical protein
MHFDGPHDETKTSRLSRQHEAILELMRDGRARTLPEICEAVESKGIRCPHSSASAQLRHLRKPRFGAWEVDKTHLGRGLYSYRLGEKGVNRQEPVLILSVEDVVEILEINPTTAIWKRLQRFLDQKDS